MRECRLLVDAALDVGGEIEGGRDPVPVHRDDRWGCRYLALPPSRAKIKSVDARSCPYQTIKR
jgi:hypothetical protein